MLRNKSIISIILILSALASSCSSQTDSKKAKYVFYFIGDGMSFSTVALAEGYNAYLNGEYGSKALCFSQFPVLGRATSFSANNLVTDSAASGTALSTGEKTDNGMMGMNPDTVALKSISYMIHDAGYNVGVSSTVPVNHATPAAFYASTPSRDDYYEIACQLPTTGFEFFGGGGLYEWKGQEGDVDAYTKIREAGYTVAAGMDEYFSKKDSSQKMMLIQTSGQESKDLPFRLDRKEGDLSHSEVVAAGIDYLYDTTGVKGFFLMSESGKIDGAEHGNDTKAAIMETIDLGDAVQIAYEFYLQHPDQTLIVVTSDHETGGISFGRGHRYGVFWEYVDSIKCSKSYAYANYMDGAQKDVANSDEYTEKANIGWTSSAHNGGLVPVFAIGAGSQLFAGRMDNTDIPKKIVEAMGIPYTPAE